MKKALFTGLCALLLCAVPSWAQWGPRTIPEPTDGLKDAYKDYFKIGVSPPEILYQKNEMLHIIAFAGHQVPTSHIYPLELWQPLAKLFLHSVEDGSEVLRC